VTGFSFIDATSLNTSFAKTLEVFTFFVIPVLMSLDISNFTGGGASPTIVKFKSSDSSIITMLLSVSFILFAKFSA
jgi:hypothetical protein